MKTATMGKKLNGRLFRINGKPFRVNGEVLRINGKLFHRVLSSCGGSLLAIIGMFVGVVRRFQEAKLVTVQRFIFLSRLRREIFQIDTNQTNIF